MGSAAVFQIAAYGAQDIYLTGQPQVTYFKSVHKRYTNFAMEDIELPISGTVAPGAKVSVTISRFGDLLKGIYVKYNPSRLIPQTDNLQTIGSNISHALLNTMEIEIGGQLIDRHYGVWLTVWRDLNEIDPYGINNQLFTASGREPITNGYYPLPTVVVNPLTTHKGEITLYHIHYPQIKYDTLSYNHSGLDKTSIGTIIGLNDPILSTIDAPNEAYIPMRFWFCQNPGLALPLVALQYHEVKFNITLAKKEDYLIPVSGQNLDSIKVDMSSMKVFGEYIYLDSVERKEFAKSSHEYLIEQLQYLDVDTPNATNVELNFNHPVKELVFCGKPRVARNFLTYNTYGSLRYPNCLDSFVFDNNKYFNRANVKFSFWYDSKYWYNNGKDYFNLWSKGTPYPIVTNYIDGVTGFASDTTNINLQLVLNQNDRFSPRNLKYFTREQIYKNHKGTGIEMHESCIGVYSFSLKPDELQPSGSCNFSRIDRAKLIFTGRNQNETLNPLNIYAINYNIFRVMSGMGGLAYSN